MEFITPYPGLSCYSFHNDDFVGVEYAESYFPEWKTIQSDGFYGDISLFARTKFMKEFLGLEEDAYPFDKIRNDAELYKKWQDFRVDAVVNFNHKIKDAVKTTKKETLFASWGIGIRGGSLAELREHFALDMPRIAKRWHQTCFLFRLLRKTGEMLPCLPTMLENMNMFVKR